MIEIQEWKALGRKLHQAKCEENRALGGPLPEDAHIQYHFTIVTQALVSAFVQKSWDQVAEALAALESLYPRVK